MARGKITYAAGTFPLGSGAEGSAANLVLQLENIAVGNVEVHGRATGSGMGYVKISGFKQDGTAISTLIADGIYKYDITGLDVELIVSAGASVDLAYNFTMAS